MAVMNLRLTANKKPMNTFLSIVSDYNSFVILRLL